MLKVFVLRDLRSSILGLNVLRNQFCDRNSIPLVAVQITCKISKVEVQVLELDAAANYGLVIWGHKGPWTGH